MSLDPAALQVLISRLAGIADEMGAVLRRSASSPNIKERADCSAAVFNADGDLPADATEIQQEGLRIPPTASAPAAAAAVGRVGADITSSQLELLELRKLQAGC